MKKKKYTAEELNEMIERNGGSLDLSGLTSIPEGFNPTVGGSLDLSGLTSKIHTPRKWDLRPRKIPVCG